MSRQGSSADMDTRREGILEVQAISPEEEKKRSWFVGEEVVSGAHQLLSSSLHAHTDKCRDQMENSL